MVDCEVKKTSYEEIMMNYDILAIRVDSHTHAHCLLQIPIIMMFVSSQLHSPYSSLGVPLGAYLGVGTLRKASLTALMFVGS